MSPEFHKTLQHVLPFAESLAGSLLALLRRVALEPLPKDALLRRVQALDAIQQVLLPLLSGCVVALAALHRHVALRLQLAAQWAILALRVRFRGGYRRVQASGGCRIRGASSATEGAALQEPDQRAPQVVDLRLLGLVACLKLADECLELADLLRVLFGLK